ncbi:Na+/H+ antiporter NhaA [Aquipuribacter nitratireducens]|uniref:Na(+)/H(+) antiporter NhaA n=1 Tax=Aquipuribacter nitratireducens TaxID=650104 RepID=A0ABW0GQF1_9MICO
MPNGPAHDHDQPPAHGDRSHESHTPRLVLFRAGEGRDRVVIADALRTETVGGAVLLVAAVVAVVWANLPVRQVYEDLREFVPYAGSLVVGPLEFGLDLSLAKWAADGLLAIFFFIVGLELKREFLAGSLRRPSQAAVPMIAAVGGMAVPALFYTLVAARAGSDALVGWAIPAATDIAFALAVLAVIGSNLPGALRAFLLTLAVVDDLLAIIIIAVFYTSELRIEYLAGALVPILVFALLVQRRITAWYLLIPLALIAWLFVHESGVHATIAGVLLGFTVPVLRPEQDGDCLASHLEHVWRPVSAGLAIPLYAFFAAGVNFTEEGLGQVFADPVAQGVVVGLVLGKVVGVFGTTWLLAKFTRAELDRDLAWPDVLGVALLAGIGFTVSLLIGELAFGAESETGQHVTAGVLFGSLISAILASLVLARRNRGYKRIAERDDAVPPAREQVREGEEKAREKIHEEAERVDPR